MASLNLLRSSGDVLIPRFLDFYGVFIISRLCNSLKNPKNGRPISVKIFPTPPILYPGKSNDTSACSVYRQWGLSTAWIFKNKQKMYLSYKNKSNFSDSYHRFYCVKKGSYVATPCILAHTGLIVVVSITKLTTTRAWKILFNLKMCCNIFRDITH